MKLILEKSEVLALLGQALGYNLAEDDVEVIAEPFEVRLNQVRVGALAAGLKTQPPTPAKNRSDELDEPPDARLAHADDSDPSPLLPSYAIDPDLRDPERRALWDVPRPGLHAGETTELPGEDYESELRP